jgi:hypothetical protein
MATIGITESDLQDSIHSLYEADATTPESTDDDYILRRRLINIAINRWENNMGTLWNELWTNTATVSTGATLTIATNDTTYAAPTSFVFPGGYVKIMNGTTEHLKIPVIKPEEAQIYTNTQAAYFTGSPNTGYVLNLTVAPSADINGFTLKYDYYKRAEAMDATTDIPEMSDPYYIVYAVVSELHKGDNNLALYQATLAEAEERLKQMVVKNTLYANYQDHGMPDQQLINTGGVFGD